MMPISRRILLGISPLALSSCARAGAYFGKNALPRAQRLVYEIGGEPETLDPAELLRARSPASFRHYSKP